MVWSRRSPWRSCGDSSRGRTQFNPAGASRFRRLAGSRLSQVRDGLGPTDLLFTYVARPKGWMPGAGAAHRNIAGRRAFGSNRRWVHSSLLASPHLYAFGSCRTAPSATVAYASLAGSSWRAACQVTIASTGPGRSAPGSRTTMEAVMRVRIPGIGICVGIGRTLRGGLGHGGALLRHPRHERCRPSIATRAAVRSVHSPAARRARDDASARRAYLLIAEFDRCDAVGYISPTTGRHHRHGRRDRHAAEARRRHVELRRFRHSADAVSGRSGSDGSSGSAVGARTRHVRNGRRHAGLPRTLLS